VRVTLSALVLRSGSQVMLLPPDEATVATVRGLGRPVRRGLGDLLAGTSCLPLTPWYAGDVGSDRPFVTAWRRWLATVGLGAADPLPVGTVRHVITHHRLLVHVVAVGVDRPILDGLWVEGLQPGARSTLVARCLGRAGVGSP
jgi:hypothetical protein